MELIIMTSIVEMQCTVKRQGENGEFLELERAGTYCVGETGKERERCWR